MTAPPARQNDALAERPWLPATVQQRVAATPGPAAMLSAVELQIEVEWLVQEPPYPRCRVPQSQPRHERDEPPCRGAPVGADWVTGFSGLPG
jgi:hypothetical protein